MVGPPGSTWSVSSDNTFSSTISGWYSVGYKIDFNVGGNISSAFSTFGSILLLDSIIVHGSGTLAKAPFTSNHQYALSNYIIFRYMANQKLQLNVIANMVGAGSTNATTIGITNPFGGQFDEAPATITITRITDL